MKQTYEKPEMEIILFEGNVTTNMSGLTGPDLLACYSDDI